MRAEVFVACTDGDLRSIQRLDKENPGLLREVTFEKNSLLHIAAREGHTEIVSWALTQVTGYRYMTRTLNADKNTALHEAAKGGNEQVIRTLLGYNKFAAWRRNQFGETALIIASENGHVEAVRLLVKATPWFMILWPRNDHQTCLHVAAYEGHLDVVKLILRRPNNWDILHLISSIPDLHGATPLHAAIHGRHLGIVNEIMNTKLKSWFNKSLMAKKDELGRCPIHLMTKKDELGRCPIHVAVLYGCLEIVKKLISIMPDCIEIRSKDLKTPLHFAVEYNQFDVVKNLLSPLNPTKVAKLVSCDRDISGNTALHLAAKNGVDPKLVKYLLSFSRVKVNAINSEGQSALDIPTGVESTNNPNLAPKNGVDPQLSFSGVKVNAINSEGQSALDIPTGVESTNNPNLAAKNGVDPQLSFSGVKVNAINSEGHSALDIPTGVESTNNPNLAAKNVVDPQLSFPGVKVNAINSEGQTALDIATAVESNNNPNFSRIAMILQNENATHSFIQHSEPFRQLKQSKIQNSDNGDKVMPVDTLVASLVATVTFAAMFQVPGGISDDNAVAKMALETLFQVFLFSNCLGFFASITVVMAWIFRERLQERLTMDRSPLAKLSLVSLEVSVMSTALSFLCTTILATIPRNLGKAGPNQSAPSPSPNPSAPSPDQDKDLSEYRFIFAGEILTASLVPTIAILILGLIWAYEYYFRATNDSRRKHKTIFKQVVIYIIPPFLLIFIVVIIYGLHQLNFLKKYVR